MLEKEAQPLGSSIDITQSSRIEELRLIEAELPDEEVGIKVGIPQNYNFSRWFKVVTDMTPFQYR